MSLDGFHGDDLNPGDVERLHSDLDLVRDFMSDGEWHTIPEIMLWTGITMDASVSRYVRYLRKPEHGGYEVQKERVAGGLYRYRALVPAASLED